MEKETGIYYEDNHYLGLEQLAESLHDNEQLDELENEITVEETDLRPLFVLDADWIVDQISEDDQSEDGDELETVRQLIHKHCDFTKVNELMPKLYYPNGKKFIISKKDLLDCL